MFVDSSCALREIGKNEKHEYDYRCNVERQLTSSALQKIVNAILIVRIHGGNSWLQILLDGGQDRIQKKYSTLGKSGFRAWRAQHSQVRRP